MQPLMTFLSDFGLQDSYVAEVKAVLLSRRPELQIVDITHEVPPFNVKWGSFQLRRSYAFFPKGTFHLAVVDPGVGTNRRNLYVKTRDYHFIGPDNGLLYWAVRDCEAHEKQTAVVYEFPVPKGTGPTFYGRDVFAPFLGALLAGEPVPTKIGTALTEREFPAVQRNGNEWVGEILGSDRFGNLITSIPFEGCHGAEARLGGITEMLSEAPYYLSIPEGKAGLVRGSHGFWEISCCTRSAAEMLHAKAGDPVTIFLLQ